MNRYTDFVVPDEDLQKIEAAAPAAAPAEVERPRKLLVYSAAPMFYHEAIPWGVEALRILGEKTGAFSVLVSDDKSVFQNEYLDQFDAICFNNTCGTPFHETDLKNNLLDFVKGGKGFVGIHCSAHTFVDWPPYGEMHGGYSQDHPWVNETVTIKVEDPAHPCVSMFGDSFQIVDEIYQLQEAHFSRTKQRVLASLDPNGTDMTKDGIVRDDFPLCWVHDYGSGRVFWTALGHYPELFWDRNILAHYLAGVQFALGDLKADTTPSA